MPQMCSRQVEKGKIQMKDRLERGLTSNEWCREADKVWNIIKSQTEQNLKCELWYVWDLCLFGTLSKPIGENQSQQRHSHYNSSV